ncbi:hypothetical protein BC830DRAFT_1167252 [Chytriomyces sp. MP71]|nr:hypothetical protein BC830DRAFT_1167252 [Chytriomyces sp. MP71]
MSVSGRTICFTGTLLQLKRAEATKKAILAGADVAGSFNKSVDLVIAGAKLDKARDQGVEIWDESAFLESLGDSASPAAAKASPATPLSKNKKVAAVSTPSRGEFASPGSRKERMEKQGGIDYDKRSDSLSGKRVVFTGTLSMKRADAASMATDAGATVQGSVSKTTEIVIAALDAGAKLDKARELGCEIWSEKDFLAVCGEEGGAEEDDDEGPAEEGKEREEVEVAPKAENDATEGDKEGEKKVADEIQEAGDIALKGAFIVFTGTLSHLKRADASKKAEAAGAKVLSSLTKAATLVVAGEDAGTKLDKARAQGVQIISEQQFIDALGGMDAIPPVTQAKKAPSRKAKASKKANEEEEEKEETDAEEDEAEAGGEEPEDGDEKEDKGVKELTGKNVVFTGTLSLMKRADAAKKAEAAGAKVLSSLTKATTLVIAGADAGAKLAKAEADGIEIWTEEQFVNIVGAHAPTSSPAKRGSGSTKSSPAKKSRV